MGSIQCYHSPEYHCRHILRSIIHTMLANRVSLEPDDSSKMFVICCSDRILVLCWWYDAAVTLKSSVCAVSLTLLPIAYSAFTDVLLAVIPIFAFWKLQMRLRTKIGICLLMGMTALCVSFSTSRMYDF